MTPLALEPWTFLIATHAVAAFAAIFLGGFQVVRRTKGDMVHRRVGRVWATLMLVVAAGSFFFGTWTEPVDWFLRSLATWTLVSVTWGWVLARRGAAEPHRHLMVGNYIGLMVAFVFVLAVPSRLVPSWLRAHPVPMLLVAVAIMAGALAVVVAAYAAIGRRPDRRPDRQEGQPA